MKNRVIKTATLCMQLLVEETSLVIWYLASDTSQVR